MKTQMYSYLYNSRTAKDHSSGLFRYSVLFSVKLLFFILIFANFSLGQNYNWITPNQTYLKMYVASDGIYRIDKNDFVNAGITVTTIDPRTVKVYYKGNQIPIYFFGEQNGTFDDADYFDFYGIRNYGGFTNAHDINNNVIYTTDEYNNLYSDTSAYFIGWGGANGLRFNDYNNSSAVSYPNDYYYQKQHFEQDLIYSLGQNINISSDFGYFSNDKYIGEGWYWRTMQTSNFFDQVFSVNSLSVTPQQCRLKVFAYPVNQSTTISNEHRLALKMNTTQLDTMYRDNFNRFDTTVYFSSSLLVNGNNTMRFLSRPATGFSGTINFDMFEVSYPRAFVFDSNTVNFNSDISDSTSKIFKIKGYNSANQLSIYDTKNGTRILNYSFSNDTLFFVGNGNGNYQIINKSITKKPFRIKQKQVPNLVSSSTGTDYLLVYNKLFETPAEQLRQYRNTHDGFRSFKAEIEDIYDVFNFGMEDPVAVRRFVKNVFDTWTTPKVKYLCLFGRGSVDPKRNLGASSVYYQNYVPVYGNPVTDGYFANFNFGAFTYVHQISVGRLPAYTNQEAQDMVNKIIGYEGQGLQTWCKTPTFITGGYYRSDQLSFMSQSDYFINSYVTSPPSASDPVKIYINDSLGLLSYNYSDSVKNTINRGTLMANFIAHAGNGWWDYVFDDPVVLSNGNKLPLVFSMTCYTGKMAEGTSRSYGEKYVTYSNKGAIGFVGTTGWSFNGTGNTYNDYLLNGLNLDTLRRIGDIVTFASQRISFDSSSSAAKNTNNCYNLIGDPAAKLIFPSYPEFDISSNDYMLSKLKPVIHEPFTFKIFPRNIGTYADSCKIRLDIRKANRSYLTKDTVLYSWNFLDTVNYYLKIDTSGTYQFKVTLDVENWYTQETTNNNEINIPVDVENYSFIPLKPESNITISSDSVEFIGLNPGIYSNVNTKLLFQIDTSSNFNSPYCQTYMKNSFTGITSKYKVYVPTLDTGITYFWRLNSISNNDTLEWSVARKFKKSLTLNKSLSGDSLIHINKFYLNDFLISEFQNIKSIYPAFSLSEYQGKIVASSWGGDPWEPSYLTINNRQKTLITNANWNGLYISIINKYSYLPIGNYHIYFTSTTSSDSVLNILNTIDSNKILSIVHLIASGANNTFNVATKNKLKELGSTKVDSFSVASWSRWSFVSVRGLPNPIVSEAYSSTGWYPCNSTYSSSNLYQNGSITQTFGPAQTWQNFNWGQDVFPNSSLYFDVYGIKRNNQDTLLMSNVTTYNNVDLSGINAYQYPYLKLITRLAIDSVSGYQSPVFKGINLNYVGPPEIALDNNSIFKSDSIVSMGDSVGIGGVYYNVGYVPLNSHVRSFYALDGAGNKVPLRSDTIYTPLKVDSSLYVKATFKVNGLPIHKKYNNQISIVLEVTALNQNDIYDYNNSVISTFFVKGSITDLNTEVYSDGIKLFGNDYVRSNPDILIKLTGKSVDELLATDTSVFRIMLNNQFISLNPGSSKSVSKGNLIKETDKGNLILKFTPQLQNGINDLKLITYKNNAYDTAKFVLNVTNETSLKDVNNFPNPMKTQTTFSFTLTGNQLPTECKIKIYSVAGRVIKEIMVPASIGFNQISWDGRDADGDYIANGVYMYRVVFKGATDIVSDIKKLAVLK